MSFVLNDLNLHCCSALSFQGYPGLDGAKGETGAVGSKVTFLVFIHGPRSRKQTSIARLENTVSYAETTFSTLSSVQGESGAPGENGAPGPMVSNATPYCFNMETIICWSPH